MSAAPTFRPVGSATPLVEATGGALSAVVFGLASAVRRAKILHPDGIAFEATLEVTGAATGAPLLDQPATHHAIVRLSRSLGVHEPRPDFLGIAVRVLDAHGPGASQDLLLITSGTAPVLRHTFAPARSFDHPRFSSVLPYRVGGRSVLFSARPLRTAGGPTTLLEELPEEVASGRLRYALDVADVTGPWRQVGVLTLGEPLAPVGDERLRFNTANSGGGIEPVGVLQGLRRLAYRGSQAGWSATG
jgi:hypothetical protein